MVWSDADASPPASTLMSLCSTPPVRPPDGVDGLGLGGPWPAVLAAVAYVWSPYVLLDAHKGGVLGESVALAIMPWALLAMHRLAGRGGIVWLAAAAGALALVVLGHNITALFFVGLA